MDYKGWKGFKGSSWKKDIDVRRFIQENYKPYEGDDSFLAGPTKATDTLWKKVMELTKKEIANGGVLDADEDVVSSLTAHKPGYIDKKLEKIVGVQTDAPFKRAIIPHGGIRMAVKANEVYGFKVSDRIIDIFSNHRKTHNQGVFDAYDEEIRMARRAGIITGLPDTYGRGRIIGDYRRLALYGTDFLIKDKKEQFKQTGKVFSEDMVRRREEISEEIRALQDMAKMAEMHGYDITKPAETAQEAIQATYFGYLAAIKQNNGAAMSFGRNAGFLDIYIERDLEKGLITEEQAQEFIDHLVMKLRIVKFMRPEEYNSLFSGDPVWATESIGGMGVDGRTLVTKTAFRIIHTLHNMGPAPEPNITVLWSRHLPKSFKDFCSKYSIKYSSLQYENDDVMRSTHGDDYAIACCVSPMKVGKQMQFFGARTNLPKALLYALNGGVDELKKVQVGPKFERVTSNKALDFDDVMEKYLAMLEWTAEMYVRALNIIHYMHDKYFYESAQMALYDKDVYRFFATGVAGLSVAADSLSAIKYAKVYPIRDKDGIIVDFKIKGDFPKYGNDDDRVDSMASELVKKFMNMIRKQPTYRNSHPTMSVLTITSNVVYGKKTGSTPDGRKSGEPFAPGANPMHNRDSSGAVASLASVSKIPFKHASDGISNTFSIVPNALGKGDDFIVLPSSELDQCLAGAKGCTTCESGTTGYSANAEGKYDDIHTQEELKNKKPKKAAPKKSAAKKSTKAKK